MSTPDHRSYGRAVTLLVLGVLVLTVCATVYLFFAQHLHAPPSIDEEVATDADAQQASADARRLVTLLTILLMSALLILLFVVGAYLVIRVGQLVARTPLGGQPTEYVDVWRSYRLTDEDIQAATAEDPPEQGPDGGSSPPSPDSDAPRPES